MAVSSETSFQTSIFCHLPLCLHIKQWSSTHLMLPPFHTAPPVVTTPPNQNSFHCYFMNVNISLLLQKCNLPTITNHDFNIRYVGYLKGNHHEVVTHKLRTAIALSPRLLALPLYSSVTFSFSLLTQTSRTQLVISFVAFWVSLVSILSSSCLVTLLEECSGLHLCWSVFFLSPWQNTWVLHFQSRQV